METPIKHVPRIEFLENTRYNRGMGLYKVAKFLGDNMEKAYEVEGLATKFNVSVYYLRNTKEFRKYGVVVSTRKYKGDRYILALEKFDLQEKENKKLNGILKGKGEDNKGVDR